MTQELKFDNEFHIILCSRDLFEEWKVVGIPDMTTGMTIVVPNPVRILNTNKNEFIDPNIKLERHHWSRKDLLELLIGDISYGNQPETCAFDWLSNKKNISTCIWSSQHSEASKTEDIYIRVASVIFKPVHL